jgi:hypothetical protein
MVEDVARDIRSGRDVEEISQDQSRKGLLGNSLFTGLTGGFGGVLGARLLHGESAWEPFSGPGGLLSKGINTETLKGLSKLPLGMKILPIAGVGLGAGLAAKNWMEEAPHRGRQTYDISRGLLAERVLQRDALRGAMGREMTTLQSLPRQSATDLPPLVLSRGE